MEGKVTKREDRSMIQREMRVRRRRKEGGTKEKEKEELTRFKRRKKRNKVKVKGEDRRYFASRRLTQSTVLNSSFIELSLGVVAFKIQWCLTVLLTSKS